MDDPHKDTPFQKLEREPLWDRAHSQLRDALLSGRFEPGSGLTLRFLAKTFGTSITPVRDAVSRLVAQGVLRQGSRSSAIVPEISEEELSHLTIIRCELEGRAALEAAKKAEPNEVQHLESLYQVMEDAVANRDFQAYLDAHRRFHFDIYHIAAIPPLSDMIENLWLRCGPLLSLVTPEYVKLLKRKNYHAVVLNAIREGKGDDANQAIVADIEQAAQYLVELMDEEGRIRRPTKAWTSWE
ncbi:GntR family transcriptional regulator [Aidingimonas lacisalsi]|uniref:GntR family transcriptional regulator n=1 Tax=Aidingimonas lacisalsi TaxID=2604086 RepID=UPI0011D261E0|nr:GntR family transcriptional regulator [Aidingimonas lacisalsi]